MIFKDSLAKKEEKRKEKLIVHELIVELGRIRRLKVRVDLGG